MQTRLLCASGFCAVVFGAVLGVPALAEDVPVFARKLLLLDKAGAARMAYLAKDSAITVGAAGDPALLSATLEIFYSDDPANRATFLLDNIGWFKNNEKLAKYRNSSAPIGGGAKTARVKQATLAKIVAKALGDAPTTTIDILAGGEPSASGLTTILTIDNGNDGSTRRFCSRFSTDAGSVVKYREINGGRKLLLRKGKPVACSGAAELLMDPDTADGFMTMPWPNDIRRAPSGAVDVVGYPGTAAAPALAVVLNSGAANTFDFGTTAAIFFRSTGPLDPTTLPTVAESKTTNASVMVVNLDQPVQPPAALLVDFRDDPSPFRPSRLLTLLPYPGRPLDEGARMAAIVFDDVKDLAGNPLVASPLIAALDDPWDPGKPVDATRWAELQAQRADVFAYVDANTSRSSSQVAAFTVFTTQSTTAEMNAISAAVAALPAPVPVSRSSTNCSSPTASSGFITGELDLPKWQAGTYPYTVSGGGIVVSGGVAVQQGTETVDYAMSFPCGPAPANGWPILLFMDGTGGSVNTSPNELGSPLDTLPYILASIAPLYGGDRSVPGQAADDLYFNLLNPLAGRTNQLQQAADLMFLRRVVDGITLTSAETASGGPVETDDGVAVISGHSQGALTIPLALAVDPPWQGAFLSAGGAGLYQTVLHRGDTRTFIESILNIEPGELDMFHPMPHAIQLLAEVGDSANYAPYVDTAHILSIGGTIDGCSPLEVVSLLGIGLGTETANPLYSPMFGDAAEEPGTVALPASANLAAGRTAVTVQLDTGHFGAITNPALGNSFVTSLPAGTPVIDPAGPLLPDTNPGCSGRYAPLP